jgi:hypothetical protein
MSGFGEPIRPSVVSLFVQLYESQLTYVNGAEVHLRLWNLVEQLRTGRLREDELQG